MIDSNQETLAPYLMTIGKCGEKSPISIYSSPPLKHTNESIIHTKQHFTPQSE